MRGFDHWEEHQGQTYYYLRETARVGGKSKVVSQRYLGKAADIEAAVGGATATPDRSRHLGFGDLAAAWGVLERLGLVGSWMMLSGPVEGEVCLTLRDKFGW